MRVNLITETSWILGRCAQELHQRLGWSVNSKDPADVDYHLPYWRGIDLDRDPRVRVGFFTHGFNRALGLLDKFDAAICMNRHMHAELAGNIPSTIIRPGVDAPARMPVFGVAGRTYSDGRKGQNLVRRMVEAGHEVVSLGPGPWPCKSHGKDIDIPATRRFFRDVDYFVVTANDEGGPMPVLEAITYHTPVIAPNVGFCWELPVIRYERGNWESLHEVLCALTVTPTWTEWADQHRRFFETLVDKEAVA